MTPTLHAPIAKIVRREFDLHGDTIVDDYNWLRDKDDPEVIAYLNAENAYTESVMHPTKELEETLYNEMLGRIKETDLSVPYRRGEYFYYARTEQGLQYAIYCRKHGTLDAPEQIVLDVNALAAGKQFMSIGAYTVSEDGQLLAFSTDDTGFRQYTLFVKNIATGELFPTRVEKTGSVVWAADNRTLFYTIEDSAKRQYRAYRHDILAGAATDDALLYEEADERFRVGIGRSRSREWLFLYSASHTATEIRCLRTNDPRGEWRMIAERLPDQEYDVDHHGDLFYIHSNHTGRNFALFTAPIATPGREHWKEILPHRVDVMLSGVDLFAHHIVLFEREAGLPHLRISRIADSIPENNWESIPENNWHRVEFPEPVYSVGPDANAEFVTNVFRYGYQSPVTPASVYDYDMDTREATLLKRTEVPGGYDASRYECARIHATASDGTQVPLSLVYAKDTPRDGSAPLVLYGYGSYGHSIPVGFSSNRFSLLDRGVIYAIAHIRGGGEMGKRWHDDGRMHKKLNTFTDFIACAEHLIAARYTSAAKLAATGGSAGGLLMGAISNMRPELFHAIVSVVPFVDVINTMLDESLPLTVGEFEEWGNPKIKADYEYMRTYCPYTNLSRHAYPRMLVRTSLHDSQVMFWEPAKYTAKLRALNPDADVLFQINMAAGHGGSSGRYDYLREVALDYAYFLSELLSDGAIGSR